MTCSLANSPELKIVAGLSLESLNDSLNLRAGFPRANCGVSFPEGSITEKKEETLAAKTKEDKKVPFLTNDIGI